MSVNLVNKLRLRHKASRQRIEWRYAVGLPAWAAASFILANIIAVAVLSVLEATHIYTPATSSAIYNTVLATAIYVMTLGITLGVPWLLQRRFTGRSDLGLTRLPTWMDITLAPAGAIVYLLVSSSFIVLFTSIFPQIDAQQAQDVGFQNLANQSQYLLAFVTLVVLAPFAEEILFRGYLYGKLKKHAPIWAAMLITGALFAAAHGQWNVAIDTFALSLVMTSLREMTGSIWAGVMLHMMKNGLAFYLLFINPSLLGTL